MRANEAAVPALDLISMADIAQMAGQSRATVGNWKRRYPEFPRQRGSSPRGPLYDTAEVVAWLGSRARPKADGGDIATVAFEMAEALRDDLPIQQQVPLILALIAAGRDIPARPLQSYHELVGALVHVLGLAEAETLLLSKLTVGDRHVDLLVAIAARIQSPQTLEDISRLLDRYRYDFGEGDTPMRIAQLMAALAGPGQSFYDPCVGFGTLLAACARESGASRNPIIDGQELNAISALCARLIFRMLGIAGDIIVADSLSSDRRPGSTYARVIADLPIGQRFRAEGAIPQDPRWAYEDPGTTDTTEAWIQECLHHLAPSGRAVLLVPAAALFAQSRSGRLRQRLIRADLLDAAITLPPGLLSHTSIAVALLIFRRDRPRRGSGTPGPVLVGEVPSIGVGRTRTLDERTAREFAVAYHAWSEGADDVPELSRAVSYAELSENDFVLQPRRHVAVVPSENVPDVSALGERLVEALKAAHEADRFISDYLRARRG